MIRISQLPLPLHPPKDCYWGPWTVERAPSGLGWWLSIELHYDGPNLGGKVALARRVIALYKERPFEAIIVEAEWALNTIRRDMLIALDAARQAPEEQASPSEPAASRQSSQE